MKVKNYRELNNADSKYNLKKISEKEVKIISVDDFWDGPLSGECIWHDKPYYFQCFDQVDPNTDNDVWPRKFLLLSLTNDQLAENRRLQRLFEESLDSEVQRNEHAKLSKEAPEQSVDRGQIVAWFEMC